MAKRELVFCTTNQEKIRDMEHILGEEFAVRAEKIELTEIQGDPTEIALYKAREAYKVLKRPLITEDTCLCFNAFKGLPGPYVKHFLHSLTAYGVYNLLHNFEDKSGYSLCTIGYADENGVKLFQGRTEGTIVSPRGEIDLGWNCIFEPSGFDKTFSELGFEQKNKISHRFRAATKLKEFLLNK